MKRTLSFVIALLFLACSFVLEVKGETVSVSVSASAYVLYCPDNGQVLLSSNMDSRLGMASTTKIMTALLTLEQASISDREVEFTSEMTAEGSSMYLKAGDVVKLSDLAAGMMTVSGNDAANAAAYTIGGSPEGFAELMNERALEIGMKNTNFVTPSGLSDPDHYSTAYDMALLMAYAMENEDFATLTAKKSVAVDFVYPQGQRVTYDNHNRLLSMYEYCVGGKTGYTMSTGRCLVTCAERDGLRLVAVTLNDRNDWEDHISLYEYGFSNYQAVTAGENNKAYRVSVLGGDAASVTATLTTEKKCVVPKDSVDAVVTTVYLPAVVFAPVSKGAVLGQVTCTLDGEVLLSQDIVARGDVAHKQSNWFIRFFRGLFK